MEKIRIVLVDDHAMVRMHMRQLLQRVPDMQVVGEAGNGIEAIHLVNRLAPDVLLLDMDMPILNGVEVARELFAAKSPVRILALSAYDDRQYILSLLSNGAAGYLTKDEPPQFIIEAVRRVAKGEKGWFSQRAALQVAGLSKQVEA